MQDNQTLKRIRNGRPQLLEIKQIYRDAYLKIHDRDEDAFKRAWAIFQQEFKNVWGYELSTGAVIEQSFELDGESGIALEVCINELIQRAPLLLVFETILPSIVEQISPSSWLEEDTYQDVAVLRFAAYGREEIVELRRWFSREFVPHALPRIIRTVNPLVDYLEANLEYALNYLWDPWKWDSIGPEVMAPVLRDGLVWIQDGDVEKLRYLPVQ
jgi:hypothetical protein